MAKRKGAERRASWLDPAGAVIDKCGGVGAVAKALGLSRSTVWRWTQPCADADQQGQTGGLVPSQHQRPLLDWAAANGIRLTPSMLIPRPKNQAA